MVIYQLKVNNFMLFKNFELDLTIPRSSIKSPILQQHSKFPNLKYKKFALLLGANASGKTTLGKVLWTIQKFLLGYDIYNGYEIKVIDGLKNMEYIEWEIVFSFSNVMCFNKVKISKFGLVYEEWKMIYLKNRYFSVLKDELLNSESLFLKDDFKLPRFKSAFSGVKKYDKYKPRFGYQYTFSGSDIDFDMNRVDLDDLGKIMRSFDPSIKTVKCRNKKNEILIEFNHGREEKIQANGKLVNEDNTHISTGTKESIYIAYVIAGLKSKLKETFYIDEKMSHVHSEIEQQIIQILITLVDKIDGQVFITSHNSDLLDMKFPNYNFMLFKKNNDGSISELIQPERLVKHHDRSLKSIVEQDVFSTAPQLDELIELHDSLFEDTDIE